FKQPIRNGMAATVGKDTQLSRNRPCRLFQRDESSAEDPAWSARFHRRTDPTFESGRQILAGLTLRTHLQKWNATWPATNNSTLAAISPTVRVANCAILRRREPRAPEAIPVRR